MAEPADDGSDAYVLARAMASEAGHGYTDEERRAIAWAIRKRAAAHRQNVNYGTKTVSDAGIEDEKYHGPYTVTQGAHLHVGRYATGAGVMFMVEGLTEDSKGKYRESP